MVEKESSGWGDQLNALKRIARRYSIPFWTLNHLRTKRAKTCDTGLYHQIRSAYLNLCESEVQKLLREIEIEKALGSDDNLEDLAAEAAHLVARVQASKEAMKANG
ncbi:hypothetical protein ACFFTN_01245 [Aminobacter aganoensis]|uniref:Uncharacterized protein n=1 Tax=Aminobacter aganoensis TaxID=83264 RepID=A0A7X0F5I4_9HYPH|nr:hypothetical protein [Aminobacter aganoensis]MBB6353516.1 hypothetical protein [Aminobacter aganoensis]